MPEICKRCWNTCCKENEILRASKLEICLAFANGIIPADAGKRYRKEDE